MKRRITKKINIGSVAIGGEEPVAVQSMCSTDTRDVEATLSQLEALRQAGCDIVRLAVPDAAAAAVLPEIRMHCGLPLVADIHFDYKLAVAAAEAGFDKIRINPGNIGSPEKVRAVVDACRKNGAAIRVGVNGGSLERELLAKYGGPLPEALAESALNQARKLEDMGFEEICLSVKSSSVEDTVAAYRILSEGTDHPLHIGITEAGTAYRGIIKSSAGIGALLLDGIGDTLRFSLTADPVEEVTAALTLLRSLGLRREGPEIISCPTCGRTAYDLFSTVKKVEELLKDIKEPVTVAVMGCVVNGPGEASHADYGIAGGVGEGLLFKKGKPVGKVPEERLPQALLELIKEDLKEK